MDNEKVKQECIKRMRKLKMHKNVIDDFEKGKLNYSEGDGFLFWLQKENLLEKVKEIEKEYNITVYHVIHHDSYFGECWCFLYIENDLDDYSYDHELLKSLMPYAYVWNIDDDYCSEFGTILIELCNGGIKRIG